MMTTREALEILARHRGPRIVVTTMTAAGVWPELSDTPFDFAYLPSSMGQAPTLGLGLALAQPKRGALVVNGDGCTLMNLGFLVTMASVGADLVVVILKNGLYEVTGGQPLVGAARTDFAGLARAAGVERVFACASREEWENNAATALSATVPTVVELTVEGRFGQATPRPRRSMEEQIRRLRLALEL
jgi:sulfopyruvate decarboxylase subunit beta